MEYKKMMQDLGGISLEKAKWRSYCCLLLPNEEDNDRYSRKGMET